MLTFARSACKLFVKKQLLPEQVSVSKMSSSRSSEKYIIWVDCEMTGLNPIQDHILEICSIITDANLKIIAEGPNIVIHQPDNILSLMDEWCIQKHGETGLTDSSRKSTISIKDAENQVLEFWKKHIPQGKCPIAGNSVYMDRLFLTKYMPLLDQYAHYRLIDVSTIKELCRRWNPKIFHETPKKKLVHRSLEDIHESIEELKYYKKFMFLPV